jgi:hypothetical protein
VWSRKHRYCALGLVVLSACSDSSPTAPTPPDTPPISVNFTLTNPGTLTVSAPVPCSADRDWKACPNGLHPQGPATPSALRTEHYTLQPGTYLLTGRVQGNTPSSPTSVRITLGPGASGAAGGGVDKSWGGSIFIGPSDGAPPVAPSVIESSCVKTFTNDAGAVEWGVIFRVVTATESQQLCR